MKSETPIYDEIVQKLEQFRTREKSIELAKNACLFLIWSLLALFLVIFIQIIFKPDIVFRYSLLSILLLFLSGSFFYFLLFPFIKLVKSAHPELNDIALRVGNHYKYMNDKLANALQMFKKYHNDPRYSKELVEESLNVVSKDIQNADFKIVINKKPLLDSFKRLLSVLALCVLVWIPFNARFTFSINQVFHPGKDLNAREIHFIITPGNMTVLSETDIPVTVYISDSTITEIILNTSREDPVTLTRTPGDTFKYSIPAVRDSLVYFASAQKQRSEKYKITVQERPLLRTLLVTVTPPNYSKIPAYKQEENVGDISALKGSHVQLQGETNKQLTNAFLQFESGAKLPAQTDQRSLVFDFSVTKDDFYFLELADNFGYSSINPIRYKIRMLPDQYPLIEIISPGKDVDLGEDMRIPLLMDARDDFGISNIQLAFQVLRDEEAQVDSALFQFQDIMELDYGKNQLRAGLNWDLSDSDMLPTETLIYFVQVFDNDAVSGPKTGRSKMYKARFPSIYELYEQLTASQDEMTTDLQEVYEKQQDLQQQMSDLALEMQRAAEMDWDKKQKAEEALKTQQEIKKNMQELSKQLEEMVDKMQKNDLVSPETIQKYQELQELYKDIMTPELEQVMKEMFESVKDMNPELLKKALEDFKLSREEMNKNLDRTISLLKKLKMEQKLDQAIKMAESLEQRQQKLEDKAATENDKERMLKEQENIHRDQEALQEMVKDMEKEMTEIEDMPIDQIQQASEMLEADSLAANMEQLEQMLQQQQMQNYQKSSDKMQQSMQEISKKLSEAKDSMTGAQQQKAMQALKQNSRQLLDLSMRQEELMKKTADTPPNSEQKGEMADQQQELASALNRVSNNIFELSKQNFSINQSIGKALGEANMKMAEALNSFEEGNNKGAADNQGQAMASLNNAVQGIQSSMQNMKQGMGAGMSFDQFMQQMQQMANGQEGINNQTLQMGMGQQLSMAQQAQMARLQAQQGSLRKSMQELAQESQGMSEVMGDLGNIVKEMEKVEQDFAQNNVTRETIQRQNRILSRMLDASKSMRERDLSRKRQAESGKDYFVKSPGSLPGDFGEKENRLEQDLLNAQKEGYTPDYLELIKQYFEALSEQDEN